MTKTLIIFEAKDPKNQPNVLYNFLNSAQGNQDIPEGIELIAKTAFLLELPKSILFFSKLIVFLEEGPYIYRLFEIADPKE